MRIRIRNELLALVLLVIVLVVVITFFPSNILRITLGLPFVLLFPGYTLMAALFPRREGVDGIERLALSFGLSIAVVPLIGLILNFTPWGIRLESILWSIALFILIMAVIAWFRRRRLPEERFGIELHLTSLGWGTGIQSKVLSIILVLTVLGALGILSYAIATPKLVQKFTEFYILPLEGMTTDYPKRLKVGEEGIVSISIVNHEYETVSYRVEVRINEAKSNEVEPIVLENDEEWTQEVSFVPQIAGEKQKLELLLYKNGEPKPYLEALRLWVEGVVSHCWFCTDSLVVV